MGRNIVLCSDGTGNSAASTTKTNVWRVYDALDLTGGDQIASFDDGVGTSSFQPLRYIGLALGIGVKRNVLDLYKFLCRNHRAGDRIFAFGFSRGAFTIRLLCGLIEAEGLIPYDSEERFDELALAAYRRHRSVAFRQPPLTRAFRAVREAWRGIWGQTPTDAQTAPSARRCTIAFVGVWDTVGAYGLPIDELTIAVNKWVWPMRFADTDLPACVQVARHALSLDDERRTFHPIRWNEPPKGRPHGESLSGERLLQVWFAGVHANVGGGYPDDRLAHIPLVWMIDEARRHGLRFDHARLDTYRAIASFDGPAYDSRAGAGVFYRYQPRSLARLMLPTQQAADAIIGFEGSTHWTPLLHHSVVRRMASGSDRYAPVSVDTAVDILAEENIPVPFRRPERVRTSISATAKALRVLLDGEIPRGERWESRARALDLVWWRRVLYFVMLFTLLALAALPLLDDMSASARGAVANTTLGDVLAPFVTLLRPFLPAMLGVWLDAVLRHTLLAVPLLLVFWRAWHHSAVLRVRIHDWAAASWNDTLGHRIRALDAQWKRHQIRRYGLASAGFLVLAILARLSTAVLPHALDHSVITASWVLAAAGLLSGALCGALARRRLQQGDTVPPTWWLLDLARRLRSSVPIVRLYRRFALTLLPILTLAATGLAATVLVAWPLMLQAQYQVRSVLGGLCQDSAIRREVPPGQPALDAALPFTVSAPCWNSGLMLRQGHHYEIVLENPAGEPDWFDRSIRTDVGGFATDTLIHRVAFLSKRWLNQNWFAPIARIGRHGGTEFPLVPIAPLPAPQRLDSIRQVAFDAIMARQKQGASSPIDDDAARAATGLFREARIPRPQLRSVFVASKDGELFLYVNDAIPSWFADTYANNRGVARVTLRDITDDWPCPAHDPAGTGPRPPACDGAIPGRFRVPPTPD